MYDQENKNLLLRSSPTTKVSFFSKVCDGRNNRPDVRQLKLLTDKIDKVDTGQTKTVKNT